MIVYQDGNYLYPGRVRPSVDRRPDDTAFGAGTFSWQDPVHSWKAGPGLNGIMTVENLFIYYPCYVRTSGGLRTSSTVFPAPKNGAKRGPPVNDL